MDNTDKSLQGSKDLTLAEVIAAPFVLRFYLIAEDGEFLPKSLIPKLAKLPNFSKWSEEVRSHPSVLKIFRQEEIMKGMKKKISQMKAAMKSK